MAGSSECRRRQLDEFAHPGRLRLHRLSPVTRDPVVASPLVIEVRVGPVLSLFDQPQFQHPVDRAVQHPGAQRQFSLGACGNFALDGITVPFARTE